MKATPFVANPTLLYRTLKTLDIAYRRVHRHPLFHALVRNNKIWMSFFVFVIPLLALVVFVFKLTHTQYYLLTGPQGSTAALVGPQLANALNRPVWIERLLHLNVFPDFTPVESCGSLNNIAMLNRGSAQLAFVEDGLPMHIDTAPKCLLHLTEQQSNSKGDDDIRVQAVMPLYLAPLHVLSNKRLNFRDVRDIRPHSKVYIGPEGSGTAFVAQLVLQHGGIVVNRQGADWDFQQAMQELLKGRIDVAFFLIALNSDSIEQLLNAPDLHFLNLESAEGLKLSAPYLEVVKIPASTYRASSREITTVAAKTILAASGELTGAEVYEITEKLSHHIHDIMKNIPLSMTKVTDSSADLFYPLHEGAVRFYSRDPPFFLNPGFVAGVGTYLSILYAGYTLSLQFLRHYRVHRILHTVDRILSLPGESRNSSQGEQPERYLRKIRMSMARQLREGRLKMEDLSVVNEFIKSHF